MRPGVIVTELGAFAVPPCPVWCARPGDHDVDDDASYDYDGSLNRQHERSIGVDDSGVAISVVEVVGGRGVQAAPAVLLDAELARAELSAAQARELAGILLQAADLLELVDR